MLVEYLTSHQVRLTTHIKTPLLPVPRYVMTKAMRACVYDQNWADVEQLLELMLKQGQYPTPTALHYSIKAMLKSKQGDRAFRLLEVMKKKGVVPRPDTYRLVCLESARKGKLAAVISLYSLDVPYHIPTCYTYRLVCLESARKGNLDEYHHYTLLMYLIISLWMCFTRTFLIYLLYIQHTLVTCYLGEYALADMT